MSRQASTVVRKRKAKEIYQQQNALNDDVVGVVFSKLKYTEISNLGVSCRYYFQIFQRYFEKQFRNSGREIGMDKK